MCVNQFISQLFPILAKTMLNIKLTLSKLETYTMWIINCQDNDLNNSDILLPYPESHSRSCRLQFICIKLQRPSPPFFIPLNKWCSFVGLCWSKCQSQQQSFRICHYQVIHRSSPDALFTFYESELVGWGKSWLAIVVSAVSSVSTWNSNPQLAPWLSKEIPILAKNNVEHKTNFE